MGNEQRTILAGHVAQAGEIIKTRNVGSSNLKGRYDLRDLCINERTIRKWTGKNEKGVKIETSFNWVGTRPAAGFREGID